MKKLLAFAAVLVSAATTFGQGELTFSTSVSLATPPISAPVLLPDGVTGPGPAYSAALYLVTGGNIAGATLIESSLTTFRSGSAQAQKFVNPVTAVVPGVAAGSQATLLFRAWETSAGSWENATIRGQMGGMDTPETFTVTLTTAPASPADPIGIEGFTMVPEPSTLTLGVLGAAALLLRRRK